MKYLMVAKAEYSSMVTLTSPIVDADGRFYKRMLDKVLKWLLEASKPDFGQEGISLVWVLEFQERGAPHVHILSNGWIGKDALAEKWADLLLECYGNDPNRDFDMADLLTIRDEAAKAGTRVEAIRNKKGMRSYMGKYAAKHEQKDVPLAYAHVGRFWGVRGFKEKQDAVERDFTIFVDSLRALSKISHVLAHTCTKQFTFGEQPKGNVRQWHDGVGVHVYRNCEIAEWDVIWSDVEYTLTRFAIDIRSGGEQWRSNEPRNMNL